jgi:anti-sigma factor RsiW
MTEGREPDRDAPCADAPADIEDLLDGLLDPETAAALGAHVETCDVCRESLAAEEDLRRAFAVGSSVPAPEGFADDVMARVRGRRLRLPLRPALAAAAAILVLAALVVPTRRPGPVGEPDRGDVVVADVKAVDPEHGASARARDLARRARLFLAAAGQTPAEAMIEELRLSGLGDLAAAADLRGLPAEDRDVVRRVTLLGEAWLNGAPVDRAEVAMVVGGVR